MDQSGKILIAIFFGLLAVAFTGDQSVGVGFSKECIDGIDNNGDSGIDVGDFNCINYPYADGGGEGGTSGQEYTSEKYAFSYFDWEYNYDPYPTADSTWCYDLAFIQYQENLYQSLYNSSGGKDTALSDYQYWRAQNCP